MVLSDGIGIFIFFGLDGHRCADARHLNQSSGSGAAGAVEPKVSTTTWKHTLLGTLRR